MDSIFPFRRILVDEASIMHLFRPRQLDYEIFYSHQAEHHYAAASSPLRIHAPFLHITINGLYYSDHLRINMLAPFFILFSSACTH